MAVQNRSCLDSRGYIVRKAAYNDDVIASAKKDLTVKPLVNSDFAYGKTVAEYALYDETAEYLRVPRFYGLKRFGTAETVKLPALPLSERLATNITLRAHQEPVVRESLKALRATGGCVLALATGAGKTLICLHILGVLKLKALIIVHKSFLLNQWRERIATFMPQAKVGIIQGNVIDVRGKDVVIGMLQSLSMKTYPRDVFSEFGVVACDECHHIAAEVFCRALPKMVVPYMIGLSATVDRKDGLTNVIHWYLGDVAYKLTNNTETDQVQVRKLTFHSDSKAYRIEKRGYRGTLNIAAMVNELVCFAPRNELIVRETMQTLYASTIAENASYGRQIMILSDRVQHLHVLGQMVMEYHAANASFPSVKIGYYTGRQKASELKESESADVILATKAMSAEGLDIPTLNAMVFATPSSDVVQAVGRILRKRHTVAPLIIDIVDAFSVFSGQARKRSVHYKNAGYHVTLEHVDDQGNYWTVHHQERSESSKLAEMFQSGECLIRSSSSESDDGSP